MCSFECAFFKSLKFVLYHGYPPSYDELKKYHGNMVESFRDLSLSQEWIYKVTKFVQLQGYNIKIINNPANYRFPIQLIRGPSSYFEIKDDSYIKVLSISSGSPYFNLRIVATLNK